MSSNNNNNNNIFIQNWAVNPTQNVNLIRRLRKGDIIMLNNGNFEFWVKIINLIQYPPDNPSDWTFAAEVDNQLPSTTSYKLVGFLGCHIYRVIPKDNFFYFIKNLMIENSVKCETYASILEGQVNI